jgi:hypothetical protein
MRIVIRLLFVLGFFTCVSPAQTQFVKYKGSPVLRVGSSAAWDNMGALTGGLIFDGNAYRIWYWGFTAVQMGTGYASSPDGIHWTKSPNPVLTWSPGVTAWPDQVIFEGGTYRMYYVLQGSSGFDAQLATSADGMSWTPDAQHNPMALRGNSGAWDDYFVDSRVVMKQDTVWKMWYTGGRSTGKLRIGYATSSDGLNWTKPLSFPVLGEGAPGSFDVGGVQIGDVQFTGSEYRMWYNAGAILGYATSSDGRIWLKYSGNPIFREDNVDFNSVFVGGSRIVQQGGVAKLWFDELPNSTVGGTLSQIGMAVDSDSGYVMADPISLSVDHCLVGLVGDTVAIHIKNYGRHSVDVTSMTLASSNYEILHDRTVPYSLAPLQADTVKVRFVPQTGGLLLDTLHIFSTSAVDTVFFVPLSGVGEPNSVNSVSDNPRSLKLFQNYPNPFNPTTEIRYQVSGVSYVKLAVYDLLGREMSVLVNAKMEPGLHEVMFDAAGLASGLYTYRLTAGSYVASRKMLLIR